MSTANRAIEDFLGRPCTLSGAARVTWGEWISSVMWSLYAEDIGSKRPNCDSGWGWQLEMAMCTIDSRVCDPKIYLLAVEAAEQDDWETSDELYEQLDVNSEYAAQAWHRVTEYIGRPR